jgi:sugar lactone lactonase YvrE
VTGSHQRSPGPAGNAAGNSWTVTPCSAEPGLLSEGPRWDAARGKLLWVDVLAGRLHRARPGADGQLHVLQTFHWISVA